jgi:hypothetical protein
MLTVSESEPVDGVLQYTYAVVSTAVETAVCTAVHTMRQLCVHTHYDSCDPQ